MKQFALLALLALLAAAPAASGNLEYYGIEDTIRDDLTVNNKITLAFNETISHLDYKLNFEIFNLTVERTFDAADCSIRERSLISCDLRGVGPTRNQLTLSFDTKGGVKEEDGKYIFSVNYGFLPTRKAFALIRLPQYSILSEEVANKSYFPADGKIISDGRSIAVFWERDQLQDETMQFSISYVLQQGIPPILIVSLTVLVIIVMVGAVVYARRRQHPAEVITSVLNQDEKRVVDILKANEGKALQKVVVKEGNFSKAKVSRLLKDMRTRGIIEIEPVSGRENRIILSMGKKAEKSQEQAKPPEPQQDAGSAETRPE